MQNMYIIILIKRKNKKELKMETFINYFKNNNKNIKKACRYFGFNYRKIDNVSLKISKGAAEFVFNIQSCDYKFVEPIYAYRLNSSVIKKGEEGKYIVLDKYEASDYNDACNYLSNEIPAIICYDEEAFVTYGVKVPEAEEDNTFNELEWLHIALQYGDF